MTWTMLSIILLPVALVVAFVMIFTWVIGAVVCVNLYKAGRHPGVDYTNYLVRLLAWVQTTRHIPKLMKAVFVYANGGLVSLSPGKYEIKSLDGLGGPFVAEVTRPLERMQSQDLMEQMEFRPDDGKVT